MKKERVEKERKVGEVADMTGLTIRTLRYYDQIGLFSPSGRTESGHRLYTEADLVRLQHVLALKDLGLPLESVKSALAGDRLGVRAIIELQIERLRRNIRREQRLLLELQRMAGAVRRDEPLDVDRFVAALAALRNRRDRATGRRTAEMNARLDELERFLAQSDPSSKEE